MGNRAVITTKENFENNGVGIYVHWNGDIESIGSSGLNAGGEQLSLFD